MVEKFFAALSLLYRERVSPNRADKTLVSCRTAPRCLLPASWINCFPERWHFHGNRAGARRLGWTSTRPRRAADNRRSIAVTGKKLAPSRFTFWMSFVMQNTLWCRRVPAHP